MPRPSFGNPVDGLINPFGTPAGGGFRVTARFGQIDADHSTPHQGVDIGNGACFAPILAMADGRVTMARKLGNANVVRIAHPQFPGYESGYAHLDAIEVELNSPVERGDRIGTLGKTGATACHLHMGMKLDGVEIDGWPLLEQNQETDMLKGTLISRIVNRQTTMVGDGTRLRPSPGTAEPPLAAYAAGVVFVPDFLVEGGLANGSRRWYGGWGTTERGTEFGYISESVLTPLTPIEAGNT
jgi:murein DD-endopeptidase MepM/ murein hydrolase activator NlpD